MNYWLVKSEPDAWSWQDHWEKSGRVEPWNGVRNYQAANNLKAMKKGDRAFFYHSISEKSIVGILEVVKEAYPDPTDEKGKFVCVDMKAIEPVPEPITLAQIKTEEDLQDLPLIRQSRLSVMPIPAKAWQKLCRMGKVKK